MNNSKRKVILVVGMHRSGTSALTGMLQQFGAHVPLAANTIIAADNPKGHWEHIQINRINDAILRHFGQTWTSWLPVDLSVVPEVLRRNLRNLLQQEIDRCSRGPVVFKDPRLCLLLPTWRDTLNELEVDCCVIFSARQPGAVARSIEKRNGLSYERGLLLWLHYNLSALQSIQETPCFSVLFPDWLDQSAQLYNEVSEALDINWPKPWQNVSGAAEKFIDQGLVHNREKHETLRDSSGFVAQKCQQLYQIIESIQKTGSISKEQLTLSEFYQQIRPVLEVSARAALDERELWRSRLNQINALINRNL